MSLVEPAKKPFIVEVKAIGYSFARANSDLTLGA